MSTGPLLQKPQPGGDNSRIAELSAFKKSEPLTDHIHLCALRKGKLRMLGGQHRTGSTETVGTVCIARTGEHVCPPVRGIHQPLTERSRTAIQERRASWRSSSEPLDARKKRNNNVLRENRHGRLKWIVFCVSCC